MHDRPFCITTGACRGEACLALVIALPSGLMARQTAVKLRSERSEKALIFRKGVPAGPPFCIYIFTASTDYIYSPGTIDKQLLKMRLIVSSCKIRAEKRRKGSYG